VAEATGILPLDFMLSVMRDAKAEPKRRDAIDAPINNQLRREPVSEPEANNAMSR
jgi:hypothetical protein